MRTVKNVAIAKDDPSDTFYIVQVADEQIKPFVVEPWQVVEITAELVEGCSWSAEIELLEGLVPYLKAHCIFDIDITPNGFTVNVSRRRASAQDEPQRAIGGERDE